MKRSCLLLTFTATALSPVIGQSHQALTDSQGCHTDDRGEDYHCHSEEEISNFDSKDGDKSDGESKKENDSSMSRQTTHTDEQVSNRAGYPTTKNRDRQRGDSNEETTSNPNQSTVLLRLAGGLGHASLGVDNSNGGSFEGGGRSFNYEAALGVNLSESFILHATLFGWSVSEPRLSFGTDGGGLYAKPEDLSMRLLAYGAGATLYMGSDNDSFLSISIGSSNFGFETSNGDGSNGDSDSTLKPTGGYAVNGMLGLEKKLSRSTGTGLYGQFGYYSLGAESSDATFDGTTIGFGAYVAF